LSAGVSLSGVVFVKVDEKEFERILGMLDDFGQFVESANRYALGYRGVLRGLVSSYFRDIGRVNTLLGEAVVANRKDAFVLKIEGVGKIYYEKDFLREMSPDLLALLSFELTRQSGVPVKFLSSRFLYIYLLREEGYLSAFEYTSSDNRKAFVFHKGGSVFVKATRDYDLWLSECWANMELKNGDRSFHVSWDSLSYRCSDRQMELFKYAGLSSYDIVFGGGLEFKKKREEASRIIVGSILVQLDWMFSTSAFDRAKENVAALLAAL